MVRFGLSGGLFKKCWWYDSDERCIITLDDKKIHIGDIADFRIDFAKRCTQVSYARIKCKNGDEYNLAFKGREESNMAVQIHQLIALNMKLQEY